MPFAEDHRGSGLGARWLALPGRRAGRPGRRVGPGRPGEVRLKEGALEHLDRVRLPDQVLGLIGAVRRLDAPQVHPDAERLGGLDRGDHVLIAGDQDGVGDRAVSRQCLHVSADLGVDALLLPARVEVAEAELDPRHLRDDPLVDGRHPVPGRVVPVHPEQLAPDLIVRVPGERLDQLVGVNPVFAPRCGAEEQLARRRVDVADINHDRVAGEQRQWRTGFGHGDPTLVALPGNRRGPIPDPPGAGAGQSPGERAIGRL